MNEWGLSLCFLVLLLSGGSAFPAQQTIPLPVTLNRQEVGDVNTRLRDTELVELQLGSLRAQLERSLSADQFAKIPKDDSTWVSPAQLEAAGVRVQFDFQNLALNLTIPPKERRVEALNLIGRPEVRANRTVLPSDFSTYLNLRGGVGYVERSRHGAEGFGDPQLRLENAVNLRGWVLENEAAINPATDKDWEKRDSRLVFDQPERRWRWTVGDLNYPVTGFQAFLPMAGLSVHRENSLQPYRIASPLGQSAFYLKENSQVEVLVNGRAVRTMQLNAGPHQISNFPLTGGANNVILRITDPVGRVEYINATFFYEPGALRQGETAFNYAVGWPSRTDPENPFYEYQSEPVASAFHRWGLSDRLTLGVNGQASERSQQAGAEWIVSTAIGAFDLGSVSTRSRELGWGHAERLQYRYYAPPDSLLKDGMLSLALRHASDRFAALTPFARTVAAGETWDWQSRYSQRLNNQFTAGLGYGEQLRRGQTASRTTSLTLSHRWQRINTDVTVQRSEGRAVTKEWTGFVSLIVHLGQRVTASASHDTGRRASQAELQFNSLGTVDSFSGALGMANNSGEQTLSGNARYYGRRAELTLSQTSDFSGEDRANLSWGTALVYADGQFGISRPVQDSFAIVASSGSLREQGGLGVQPQRGSYTAREDALGPAVLPQVTSYHPTRVVAEPLQSSAEFDPQEGDVLLKPTYRSGTLVRIGHVPTANVTATLAWANGKPATLQSGTLTMPDGTKSEFITNREGVTYLHGLAAGPYRATLDNYPDAPFTIQIPSNQNITVDLGTIRIPTTE